MVKFCGALAAALALAGCQTTSTGNPMASMPKAQQDAAMRHAETRPGISTVAFKELGDTKRYDVMAKVVRDTWGESCRPTAVSPNGYSPNGDSQWHVHCQSSALAYDYLVTLPERADGNAHALQCYADGAMTTCSVAGRPKTS